MLKEMLEQSSKYELYTKQDGSTNEVVAAARVNIDDDVWTIIVFCASVQPRVGNGRELLAV